MNEINKFSVYSLFFIFYSCFIAKNVIVCEYYYLNHNEARI
jgi:hypothetical protein